MKKLTLLGVIILLTFQSIAQQINYEFEGNLTDTATTPNPEGTFSDFFTPANTTVNYAVTPSGGQGVSLAHGQYVSINNNYQSLITNNDSFEVEIDFRYTYSGSNGGTIPLFAMKNRGTFDPGITLRMSAGANDTFNIQLQIVSNGDGYVITTANPAPLNRNEEIKLNFKLDFITKAWSFTTNGTGYNGGFLPADTDMNFLKSAITGGVGAKLGYEGWSYGSLLCCQAAYDGTMIVDNFKLFAPARPADPTSLRTALQQMTDNILGNIILTQTQKDNYTNDILANLRGNYTNAKPEIDAYFAAFEANYPPLFSDRSATYNLNNLPNEEKITYYLKQDIFDSEFVPGNMTTIAGTKFREADVYPGPVSAAAPRVSNGQVNINATHIANPGFFLVDAQHGNYCPTGYYAAPGELITVTVPPEMVNQNIEIMIGAHIREAYFAGLKRFQRISKQIKITNTTTLIANPFGGAVFFKIPRGIDLGWHNVTISGAVKSPYFRMLSGQPQNEGEWITDFNNNYVPWVDIESDRMMFTLPRTMVNPVGITAVMQKWNDAMTLINNIAGRSASPIIRSEYVQVDCTFKSNTAGYPKRMHSNSYNDLTYTTNWNPLRILDNDFTESNSNSLLFHEMGHNMLFPVTHGGFGEVVVQLFTTPLLQSANNDLDYSLQNTEHEKFDLDLRAMHWMITSQFRANQSMEANQRSYQLRGGGFYHDIAKLYGWENGVGKMHEFMYDQLVSIGNTNSSFHYGRTVPTSELFQGSAERIGENLLPLFHFWGFIPGSSDISTYTSMTVEESCKVYNLLNYYKSLVPTTQAEFTRWRDALFAGNVWTSERPLIDDILANYETQNIGNQIIAQIDNILNIYYPNGSACSNFKTTWTVTAGDTNITIPTDANLTYNYQVDWNGDGDFLDTNETTSFTGDATHDFGAAGTYSINIKGTFPRILFNNTGDKDKIVSVDTWGNIQWQSMLRAFYGCTSLTVADDAGIPDLSNVTDVRHMFRASGISNTGNLDDWDVSNVTDFRNMFRDATAFDQSLGRWDISNATNMNNMFNGVTISTANYDKTLIGWATQDEKEAQIPSNINFHGGNSRYCLSDAQRTQLMAATSAGGYGWTITDSNQSDCKIKVSPVVFLQGAALNANASERYLMRDDLRVANVIPTRSPYSDNLACDASVFNTTGADAIVDWVWVELRNASNTSSVIAARSALLQRDGDVVDIDGISPVLMTTNAFTDYHVVIKHRNHLGIMSAVASKMITNSNYLNFTDTTTMTFGTNAQTTFGMLQGASGMWSGNANGDIIVQYSGTTPDSPSILSEVLNDSGNFLNFPTYILNGYNTHDINLDGKTQYSGVSPDTPFILQNVLAHPGNFLNFSTYQIQEQLPEN